MHTDITRLTLIAATANRGKLREFIEILSPSGIRVISPDDAGVYCSPQETGSTFKENSLIKAREWSKASGICALADDSGLTVECLCGRPGVYSARYGGDELNYQAKMALLLDEIAAANDIERRAAFVTVLSLAFPDGREYSFEGRVDGTIAYAPQGDGGFGYDPIFIPEGYTETFGVLPQTVKNGISHRARALHKLCESLDGIIQK